MTEPLPQFRYHPDPVATGCVKQSSAQCVCCGHARGYIYTGPVYAAEEYTEEICPWCIADGSAHADLDAEFVDIEGIGEDGSGEPVDPAIAEEVAFKTPGFAGWQQERWMTCCNDASAFLGRVGYAELMQHGPGAIEALRVEGGWGDDAAWRNFLEALSRDEEPSAYLFRCLHCGKFAGYSDTA